MKMIEILAEIYKNPGIHVRELSRKVKIELPAVKNHLNKLLKENLIYKKYEGRNLKFFLNVKNLYIIPYLYQIEYLRMKNLPKTIKNIVFDFLSSLKIKPTLTVIFGSYARGNYTKTSDVDIMLVFNDVDEKDLEVKARLVNSRYSIRIEPIYLSWDEFKKKFFDEKDSFMKEVKENKIIINGMEYWVMLENEKA